MRDRIVSMLFFQVLDNGELTALADPDKKYIQFWSSSQADSVKYMYLQIFDALGLPRHELEVLFVADEVFRGLMRPRIIGETGQGRLGWFHYVWLEWKVPWEGVCA